MTITHLTPSLAQSRLYKGLAEQKDSLQRYRNLRPQDPERTELADLMREPARAVDLDGSSPDRLWTMLLETEGALITDGLHVVGRVMTPEARAAMIDLMPSDPRRAPRPTACCNRAAKSPPSCALFPAITPPPSPAAI